MRLDLATTRLAVFVAATAAATAATADPFDSAFWATWGDGRAEIATYDLVMPRYGTERMGTAVTVFVTEDFSRAKRVKADAGHPVADLVPVLKLNRIEDFPTGIYDYNLMTSVFVAALPLDGQAGAVAKVTFSSQEWCGHVFHQLVPRGNAMLSTVHSYFAGEESERELTAPKDGLVADALWHWARGLAAPFLAPSERRAVSLLTALDTARLGHQPLTWVAAELVRGAAVSKVAVPAGTFAVTTHVVEVAGQAAWTFEVEAKAPHRIIRWRRAGGGSAVLVASDRVAYWQLNGGNDRKALERIGLEARPPRTP